MCKIKLDDSTVPQIMHSTKLLTFPQIQIEKI